MAQFFIGIVVIILLVASYIRRGEWVTLCSMSMSITVIIGAAAFIAISNDPSGTEVAMTRVAVQRPTYPDEQQIVDQRRVASVCGTNGRPGCDQVMQTGAEAKRAVKQTSTDPVTWLLNQPRSSVSSSAGREFVISGINVSDTSLKKVRGTLKPDATHRELKLTLMVQDGRREGKDAIPAGARFSLVLEVPRDRQNTFGGAIFVFRYIVEGQQTALFWYLTPSTIARLWQTHQRSASRGLAED
jgi:hypothetical protein